jgi:putative transposase
MISFIDEHRSVFGVEPICKLLPIAPSTYYENVAKRLDVDRLSVRARSDISLKIEIRRVFEQNFQVYGVRKVWRQLKREGFDAARCTVARLMRSMSLQGVIRGKPIRTTFSDKTAPSPLDRVNRQFKAPAPNRLWVSDFTYVATWQGFVYVALSSMSSLVASSAGGQAGQHMQASSSMPWSRLFMIGVQFVAAALCIIRIVAFNTCRSSIPNAWQRQASSRPLGVSVTATITRSQKRSTVFTRPRSSIGADHGETSKRSNSPPWNGLTSVMGRLVSSTLGPHKHNTRRLTARDPVQGANFRTLLRRTWQLISRCLPEPGWCFRPWSAF